MSETGTFTGEIWRQLYTAQQLQDAAANQVPIIQNGYWYTWDIATGLFVNSGVPADVATGKLNVIGKGINLIRNAYFIGGGSQQGGGQFPINQRAGYVVPPGTPLWLDGADTGRVTDSYYPCAVASAGDWDGVTINGTTYSVWHTFKVPGYTGAGYGIDGWDMNDPSGVVEISSDKITVSASAQYGGLVQKKELASLQDGLTYTLSILTSYGLYWQTFTLSQAGSQFPVGWFGVDGLYSYIGVIGGVWQIYLVDNADGISHSVSIKAAKLELGPEQTLSHQENGVWVLNDPPPNFGFELIKCATSRADPNDTYANKTPVFQ